MSPNDPPTNWDWRYPPDQRTPIKLQGLPIMSSPKITMPPDDKQILTLSEGAAIIGCSYTHVLTRCQSGAIKAEKHGTKSFAILRSDAVAYRDDIYNVPKQNNNTQELINRIHELENDLAKANAENIALKQMLLHYRIAAGRMRAEINRLDGFDAFGNPMRDKPDFPDRHGYLNLDNGMTPPSPPPSAGEWVNMAPTQLQIPEKS